MNKSEEKFLRTENSICYSMSNDWKISLSWSPWNGRHAGKITLCHTSWLALMCCSCLPLCRRPECYTLTFWSSLQFIFSPGFSKLLKREQVLSSPWLGPYLLGRGVTSRAADMEERRAGCGNHLETQDQHHLDINPDKPEVGFEQFCYKVCS